MLKLDRDVAKDCAALVQTIHRRAHLAFVVVLCGARALLDHPLKVEPALLDRRHDPLPNQRLAKAGKSIASLRRRQLNLGPEQGAHHIPPPATRASGAEGAASRGWEASPFGAAPEPPAPIACICWASIWRRTAESAFCWLA